MAEFYNRKTTFFGFVRVLVTGLVILNLLALIFSKSIFDNVLLLNSESVAWIDFGTHAIIVAFALVLAWKANSLKHSQAWRQDLFGTIRMPWNSEMSADKLFMCILAAFAIVVLATVPRAIAAGIEPTFTAVRHALLVLLPIISFAFICPRILARKSYFVIFAAILFVFFNHSILTIVFWLADTKMFLYRTIARQEGRAPMILGNSGMWVTGMAWNPNTLAIALLLIPPIAAIAESMVTKTSVKWLYRVTIIVLAAHLLLTFSRAASITLIVSSIIWICCSNYGKVFKSVSISILVVLSAGLLFMSLQLGLVDPSMIERLQIWSQDFSSIQQHPWGRGLPLPATEQMPHNFVLGTIEYFGCGGLMLLVLLLALLFIKATHNVTKGTAQQFALMTIAAMMAFHALFEYYIGHPTLFANSLFWLTLGFLTAKFDDEKHLNENCSIQQSIKRSFRD